MTGISFSCTASYLALSVIVISLRPLVVARIYQYMQAMVSLCTVTVYALVIDNCSMLILIRIRRRNISFLWHSLLAYIPYYDELLAVIFWRFVVQWSGSLNMIINTNVDLDLNVSSSMYGRSGLGIDLSWEFQFTPVNHVPLVGVTGKWRNDTICPLDFLNNLKPLFNVPFT